MAKEKKLRLQLLGALILLGRFFMAGFQAPGCCMAGVPYPGWQQASSRAVPAPSLTLGESLTWTALEWRLSRPRPDPGPVQSPLP